MLTVRQEATADLTARGLPAAEVKCTRQNSSSEILRSLFASQLDAYAMLMDERRILAMLLVCYEPLSKLTFCRRL